MSSQSDATASYRGYRRQILYTLYRILESGDDTNLVFQPEGQEDLAIFDNENQLLEIVQVKDYSSDLTLSSFSPDKRDSFYYRVATKLEATPGVHVSLVS